jgi:hypothetical protein
MKNIVRMPYQMIQASPNMNQNNDKWIETLVLLPVDQMPHCQPYWLAFIPMLLFLVKVEDGEGESKR